MVKIIDPSILNPKKNIELEHYYIVHVATKSRFPTPYFVVVNRRTTEAPYCFKCVGFWSETHPLEKEVKYNIEDVKDVMIPWSQIAFVESTQYKHKQKN